MLLSTVLDDIHWVFLWSVWGAVLQLPNLFFRVQPPILKTGLTLGANSPPRNDEKQIQLVSHLRCLDQVLVFSLIFLLERIPWRLQSHQGPWPGFWQLVAITGSECLPDCAYVFRQILYEGRDYFLSLALRTLCIWRCHSQEDRKGAGDQSGKLFRTEAAGVSHRRILTLYLAYRVRLCCNPLQAHCLTLFWDRVSVCHPGWPGTHGPQIKSSGNKGMCHHVSTF